MKYRNVNPKYHHFLVLPRSGTASGKIQGLVVFRRVVTVFEVDATTSRLRTTASMVLRSERNSSLRMPAVYPAILPIDSSMSSTRRRSALRDLNAVRLDDRLHSWPDRAG
jgi:hypothetical protein